MSIVAPPCTCDKDGRPGGLGGCPRHGSIGKAGHAIEAALERSTDGICLTIPGDPVPWAPKTGNPMKGGKFVPARQSKHAGKIIDCWERGGFTGWLSGDEQLAIDCTFFVQRPKGHFGTGRNAATIKDRFIGARPTGRPDLSNLVKQVEDALTTHAWRDDDQVVRITAKKLYTFLREEQPRSLIRIAVAD